MRTLVMMIMVVATLHVVGFLTLIAVVAPNHYNLGVSGTFTIGIGVTAYTLGMRPCVRCRSHLSDRQPES